MEGTMLEIDLGKLIRRVLRRAWLIVLCGAIAAVGAYYYTLNTTSDTYTAYASMYVSNNNPNAASFQYASTSDLDTAIRLAETYKVVIRSNKVLDVVAERLGGTYSTDEIASCIYVDSVADTEVMQIYVTTGDPELSMNICNAVAEVAPSEIIRVVNVGSVEVIDYATLPLWPNQRPMMRNAAMAALLVMILLAGGLALYCIFDGRVWEASDLQSRYKMPVLGDILEMDDEKKRARKRKTRERKAGSHYILNKDTPPAVAEAYRMLRGNLRFALMDKNSNVVLVSSTVPGEGKSTVCCNLAIITAAEDRRVLLIDADMRRSRLAAYLGVRRKGAGLSGILEGDETFDSAVMRGVRGCLDFLPAGSMPSNPSELLGSKRTSELLRVVSEQYDLVLIDSPPLNVVNDALLLSQQDMSLLLVVRSGFSRYSEIERALEPAKFARIDPLGFVLTRDKKRSARKSRRYSAYYRNYDPAL
ncbi:MAG: polysaccharide biosynthesis tyrosine autokinase [Clostridia bacterium]|nr:polysaccharide biosynthesis tyrosine autokinase [Clostridia bacterium]